MAEPIVTQLCKDNCIGEPYQQAKFHYDPLRGCWSQAVALSIEKRQISTPQEAKTYVSICIKLGMVDSVSAPTPHAIFGGRRGRSTYVV